MRKLIIFSFVLCAVLLTTAATNVDDYLRARRRMINREIIGTNVVYTYARGKTVWKETNTLQRVVQRTAPIRYSKLKLIVAAKAAGKWEDVKAAIKAMDLEDEWNACQFVTSDYPAYIAATNTVITTGVATQAEVNAFMRQAEDN